MSRTFADVLFGIPVISIIVAPFKMVKQITMTIMDFCFSLAKRRLKLFYCLFNSSSGGSRGGSKGSMEPPFGFKNL